MEKTTTSYAMNDATAFLDRNGLELEVQYVRDDPIGCYFVTLHKDDDAYLGAGIDLAEAWKSAVFGYERAQLRKKEEMETVLAAMLNAVKEPSCRVLSFGPVYSANDKWFFLDNDDAESGPFLSREEAVEAMHVYAEKLTAKKTAEANADATDPAVSCGTNGDK